MEEPLTEADVSFYAFTAHDFESFLSSLQTREPMIHQLFPSMWELLNDIQSKFIKKKKRSLTWSPLDIYIDVSKKENLRPLNLIDIGTKANITREFLTTGVKSAV